MIKLINPSKQWMIIIIKKMQIIYKVTNPSPKTRNNSNYTMKL